MQVVPFIAIVRFCTILAAINTAALNKDLPGFIIYCQITTCSCVDQKFAFVFVSHKYLLH